MRVLEHVSLAFLLGLAGCGGESDGRGGDDGGGGGAPTVTISPKDGKQGVLVDTPLALAFSEPMDTDSVESAWISASLPAADMVFSWDETQTVLTVDASAALQYAYGGVDVEPNIYFISLDVTATDVEGDALAARVDSLFYTARDITMRTPATTGVSAGTGSFNGASTTPVLRVGDGAAGETWRAFVSFDLSGLPDDIIEWKTVGLFARQVRVVGTPYVDLGTIGLGAITPISEIGSSAVSAVARYPVGFSASRDSGDPGGNRTAFVTEAIEEDYGSGHTRSTFRLEFGVTDDLDGDDDHAEFEEPRLDLLFIAP